MQKHLVILFGGSSSERRVSVASAQNIIGHLPEARLIFWSKTGELHDVSPTELKQHQDPFTTDFTPQLPPFAGRIDAALDHLQQSILILALHGTEGEDGSLQALLEAHHIPYTGTDARASRIAFDKKLTKLEAQKHHIPLTEDLLLTNPSDPAQQDQLLEFYQTHQHIVLKPVANGSSVGLFIIHSPAEFESARTQLAQETGAYLAERFLVGREITVGVMHDSKGNPIPLPCSEVRVIKGRQFDYAGKYLGKGVEELTPAPIGPEETLRCQETALKLHQAIGCFGYTRTDMILTAQGPVLLEINTLPGLSSASFIPQQLAVYGMTLRDFFLNQIELAQMRITRS